MKRKTSVLISMILCVLTILSFAGCGSDGKNEDSAGAEQSADNTSVKWESLEGKSLLIYCGAGMKQPFEEIAANFKEATKADVEVTFGNAAQIVSQITATEKGDLFIAGAEGELKPLQEKNYVTDSKQLVKHIPVIAVSKGNPAQIKTIADLSDARLVLGDAQSTPIGKIGDAVLKDAGLLDKANIIARTTTAPEMVTALATGECDAAVVWKENAAKSDEVEVVDAEGMENYIKVIPAASLSCSENSEALTEFLEYLASDEAAAVWIRYGYELV